MTSLSRLEAAYHGSKLLIEHRHQQQTAMQHQQEVEKQRLEIAQDSRETALKTLRRDRLIFVLHAKIFIHSFLTLWYEKPKSCACRVDSLDVSHLHCRFSSNHNTLQVINS